MSSVISDLVSKIDAVERSFSPRVVADVPSGTRAFSKSEFLSRCNNPADGVNWPAWAVAAMVHSFVSGDIGRDDELVVSYFSTFESISTPTKRTSLMGIGIGVAELYYWDWGPVPVETNSTFVTNPVAIGDYVANV